MKYDEKKKIIIVIIGNGRKVIKNRLKYVQK